jgi:polysaccharide export outer membrane protein
MPQQLRLLLIAIALVTLLPCCSRALAAYPYAEEPDPRKSEYVLGVSDEVVVRVWQNRELDTTTSVRPDGTITLPLLGDIRAVGLTPSQLRGQISALLAAYVKDNAAVVTVAVSAINSYTITVSGSVVRPGLHASARYLTVSEAIALSGGPSRFASPQETILLRRRPDGTLKRIPIRYDLVMAGLCPEQDLILLAGDQLHLP